MGSGHIPSSFHDPAHPKKRRRIENTTIVGSLWPRLKTGPKKGINIKNGDTPFSGPRALFREPAELFPRGLPFGQRLAGESLPAAGRNFFKMKRRSGGLGFGNLESPSLTLESGQKETPGTKQKLSPFWGWC